MRYYLLAILGLSFLSSVSFSAYSYNNRNMTPDAANRSYTQNYKDMVLATCIANAYHEDKSASFDAGSSVSALQEWTYYDLEKSPLAVRKLIADYLSRDYSNPLVEHEVKGVKFNLLKCLDVYHSKELQKLASSLVLK